VTGVLRVVAGVTVSREGARGGEPGEAAAEASLAIT
jgi:hypothetical protein